MKNVMYRTQTSQIWQLHNYRLAWNHWLVHYSVVPFACLLVGFCFSMATEKWTSSQTKGPHNLRILPSLNHWAQFWAHPRDVWTQKWAVTVMPRSGMSAPSFWGSRNLRFIGFAAGGHSWPFWPNYGAQICLIVAWLNVFSNHIWKWC